MTAVSDRFWHTPKKDVATKDASNENTAVERMILRGHVYDDKAHELETGRFMGTCFGTPPKHAVKANGSEYQLGSTSRDMVSSRCGSIGDSLNSSTVPGQSHTKFEKNCV